MNQHRLFAVAAIIFATFSSHAQSRDDFEAVLVPVYSSGPGAYGSEWTSILRIFNGSELPADYARPVYVAPCPIAAPCLAPVPPNTAVGYGYLPTFSNGSILWEPKTHQGKMAYELRVRDTSRALLTWGTEIPVVRESEFSNEPIQILDVPMTAEFRQTLRVYSLSGHVSAVRLRIYSQPEPNFDDPSPVPSLLIEGELQLQPALDPDAEPVFRLFPTSARVDNLAASYPLLSGREVVRIELLTSDQTIPVWAFVSVTNNETQHVTTLTPR